MRRDPVRLVRSSLLSAAVAFLLSVSAVSAETPGVTPPSLESLAWMAGSWASDSAGARIEEHWTAPAGGLMVGMHRDVKPGKRAAFEFLRIAADAEGIAYLAQPGGRPVTRFPLKSAGAKSVVFEKPDHDFPKRIHYWLDEQGRLHARVEGNMGDKEASEEWCWEPAGLKP
jgi:hypothetical protein